MSSICSRYVDKKIVHFCCAFIPLHILGGWVMACTHGTKGGGIGLLSSLITMFDVEYI